MKETISRNCIEICRISIHYIRTSDKRKTARKKLREIWISYKHLEGIKRQNKIAFKLFSAQMIILRIFTGKGTHNPKQNSKKLS